MGAEGTAFQKKLLWVGDGSGGFQASGTYSWDSCLQITVYVVQGTTVATAQGGRDDGLVVGKDAKNNPTWTLTKPLETISQTAGELKDGPAVATAVAVMTTSGNPPTQVDSWSSDVVLDGRPS